MEGLNLSFDLTSTKILGGSLVAGLFVVADSVVFAGIEVYYA